MVGPKTPKLTLSDFHNKFLFKKCFSHFILNLVALNPTLKVKNKFKLTLQIALEAGISLCEC